MKNTIKNTTSAFEKKLDIQEDLMKIIRQVRKQRTSSVMDLQNCNPALYEQFSAALYYFLMPATEGMRFMLSHQDSTDKHQTFEEKFASTQLSTYTSSLLASLQSMGLEPADIMNETWLWLFSGFTDKSRKNAGRLRIDVLLDVKEDFLLPSLYMYLNNHLLDTVLKVQKTPYTNPMDEPVAGEDALTLGELLCDNTQLIENTCSYLCETDAFSQLLEKNKLSASEKLYILLLGLGCGEMPKAIKSFAQEISPATLRTIVRNSCPSLNLDSFPLEEALCDLSAADTKRISSIKRSAIHLLKEDEKFKQCLLSV